MQMGSIPLISSSAADKKKLRPPWLQLKAEWALSAE
jgi:hypothetical protein